MSGTSEMAARRQRWREHNELRTAGPLLLVYPEGSWAELLTDDQIECHDPHARWWEYTLRQRLYAERHFHCDNVVEAEWVVNKVVHSTGWGLEPRRHEAMQARGAWSFDPVVRSPADLDRLTTPRLSLDEAATERDAELARATFGDLLSVRVVGQPHISFHLFNQWTSLRGLDQTYMDMVADPDFVHAAMRRLTSAHLDLLDQYEQLGLFSPNNDNTYQSTGGNGYCESLQPASSGRVDTSQLWASAESQELEPVSPDMHREFAMTYEAELLSRFGLTGYGCCEGLHDKLADVFELPGIRRISLSPFCSLAKAMPQIEDKYIASWKPQPSHLVGEFNEPYIRDYLSEAVAQCRGSVLEVILKDTHTCQGEPERFDRWTRICREVIDEATPAWTGR